MTDGAAAESWEFRLSQPPAALWPLLADTRRLHEALDMPRYEVSFEPEGETRKRVAKSVTGARALEWEEAPFEWVAGQWWRFDRRFTKGPLARFGATLYLRKSAGGGTLAQYALSAEPSGLIGSTLLSSGYLRRAGDAFVERAEEIDNFLAGARATPFPPIDPAKLLDSRAAIDGFAAAMADSPFSHGVGAELAGVVAQAPAAEVEELRVRRLARMLDVSERAAAELCLLAADVGLLRRRLVVLCPRCRQPVLEASTLAALPERARCEADAIDFAVDLAVNVEALFAPSLEARPEARGVFCASGPMTAPHVLIQQRLEPGERRAFPYAARSGGYRVRIEPADGRVAAVGAAAGGASGDAAPAPAPGAPASRADMAIDYGGGPFPVIAAVASGAAFGGDSPDGAVVFENHTGQPRLICLERREWRADALTAAELSPLQAYREIFPDDAPTQAMRAGRITFTAFSLSEAASLFTAHPERDAVERLDGFFAAIAESARARNGGLIRSIGERGLGAFLDPSDAARFALDVRDLAATWLPAAGETERGARSEEEPSDGDASPQSPPKEPSSGPAIGVGVAAGRAMALNRGRRFDYAGLAPLLAERLAEAAAPGEIAVMADLMRHAALAEAFGEGARRDDAVAIAGLEERVGAVFLA